MTCLKESLLTYYYLYVHVNYIDQSIHDIHSKLLLKQYKENNLYFICI